METCVKNDCYSNCGRPECELCTPCLIKDDLDGIYEAYRENGRRGGFKRIFPAEAFYDDEFIKTRNLKNQIALKWFKEKCKMNNEWC